jgi:hypothetical protein
MPEADAKFAQACAQRGTTPTFIAHPLLGRAGERIQVGVARLGSPTARNVLLVLSGEHGIEGYAGAGVQTALLERGGFDLGDDCALLFVHQINPWGCAWDRRENENNVDLFRNLTYSVKPSSTDPLYGEIDAALNLKAWTGAEREAADSRYRRLVQEHGLDRVVAAMRRGQSDYPKGMTYHGAGPTWSKLVLDQILREHLQGAARLFVLNLHTGFGAYGEGIIVCYEDADSRNFRMLERLFGQLYAPGADASIPTHRDPLPWAFAAHVVPGLDVCMIAVEYGTRTDPESILISQGNLYFHMHDDPTGPEAVEIARRYRDIYYPEEDPWKEAVARRGLEVFDKSLAELKRLAADR